MQRVTVSNIYHDNFTKTVDGHDPLTNKSLNTTPEDKKTQQDNRARSTQLAFTCLKLTIETLD